MVFTMACPNFKKGLKVASGPFGVKTHVSKKSIILIYNNPHLMFVLEIIIKNITMKFT
jgi:hypothetical protein